MYRVRKFNDDSILTPSLTTHVVSQAYCVLAGDSGSPIQIRHHGLLSTSALSIISFVLIIVDQIKCQISNWT